MTRDADFKAMVRARAQRDGVPYARARREALDRAGRAETLHVTNGDSAAMTIRTTGLDGDVLAWRDILHDGPVPAGLGPAALRDERARFLAEAGHAERAAARRELAARDTMLARARQRYVLWFEADLYDQLQLVQILDRLAESGVESTRIELVSAGEYPGVAHRSTSRARYACSTGRCGARATCGSEAGCPTRPTRRPGRTSATTRRRSHRRS